MAHCKTCSCSLLALQGNVRANQRTLTSQALDGEISRLTATVIALSIRRNALLPMAQLPPEVLCLIFRLCHDTKDEAQSENIRQSMRISHVCTQWRQIALDEARMWDYADFERLPLAKEVLQRSKAFPLEVSLNLTRRRQSAEQIFAVKLQIPRLHRMTLQAHPRSLVYMKREWTLPSRLLRDIRIIPHKSRDSVRLVGDLGEDFLVAAPAHFRLLLKGHELDWQNPLFSSNLRVLEVCKLIARAPAFEDMVAALVRMPNLETLTLDCALPDDVTEFALGLSSAPDRITLGHLKMLKLLPLVTMTAALSLLHRIVLPAECSLHLVLTTLRRSRNSVHHKMLHQEMASLLRAHVAARPVTGIEIDISSNRLRFTLRKSHSDGEALLSVCYPDDFAVSAAFGQYWKLFSRLPATSLDVHSTHHVDSDIWSTTLSQMPSVTDLRVHDTSEHILSILRKPCREQGTAQSDAALLPLLSSITIVDEVVNNRLGKAIRLLLGARYGPDSQLPAPLRRLSVVSPTRETEAALNDLRVSTGLEITTSGGERRNGGICKGGVGRLDDRSDESDSEGSIFVEERDEYDDDTE